MTEKHNKIYHKHGGLINKTEKQEKGVRKIAIIGNWGDIIKFETSDQRILTLDKLKYTAQARISKHNMIGRWPIVEFIGPDLLSVTFSIQVNALLKVKPKEIDDLLWYHLTHGTAAPLVLGGRNVCSRAMLTNMSNSYDVILKHGEIMSMSIDLTMTAAYL